MATIPSESTITKRPAPPLAAHAILSPGDVPKRPGGDQWAVLAGLRFVLAVFVLTGHTYTMFARPGDWTYFGRWMNQEGSVFGFFLISGYSIAASLERSAAGFYQRRVNRIWPLYLATIGFGAAVCAITGLQFTTPNGYSMTVPEVGQFIGTLFMVQSFATAPIGFIGATWSLSIEWWLYVVAPILKRLWTPTIAILAAASAYYFIQGYDLHDSPWITLSWLWLLGFLYYRHRAAKWAILLLTIPCMLVLQFHGILFLATTLTILMLATCRDIKVSLRLRAVLLWLGDLSYPLYLIHTPTIILLSFWHIRSSAILDGAAIAVAIALLYTVDYPSRRRSKPPLAHQVGSNGALVTTR